MFELVGMLAVWLFGLAMSLCGPVILSGFFGSTGDGLSDLVVGLFIGKIIAFVYVAATVAYLAAT